MTLSYAPLPMKRGICNILWAANEVEPVIRRPIVGLAEPRFRRHGVRSDNFL